MITLSRLCSETGLFDEIRFKPGLNIIMGRYSGTEKSPDINGIGKSSVIRLIDFALLSTSLKKYFRQPKYHFLEGHSFSLELATDNAGYTIKRFFSDAGKVWFGNLNEKLVEYEENEIKQILADKFFISDNYKGYTDPSWYRNLIRFHIKDDLNNRSRVNPLNFIHHTSRLPYLLAHNFFLLGLPNKHICQFDKFSQELRNQKKHQKILENKLAEDTGGEFNDFNTKLIETEKKVSVLEETLRDYQFLKSYKEIEKELINIANKVSQKNRELHKLSNERERYLKSVRIDMNTDVEKITRLYQEVSLELAEFVRYELDNILEFREKIAENRKKFLQKRVNELDKAINILEREINELDIQRSKLLKFLDEQEALDSLKNTYSALIEQRARYEKYSGYIQQIKDIELDISKTKERISSATTQTIQELQTSDAIITELKTLFYDIICNAIFYDENHEDVKFDIHASASGRIPARIEIDVPKSEALGNFVFKILAYDLTVFLNIVNNNRKLPFFLIHDGVFHGVGQKTLINTLNYLHNQFLQHNNFQYIVTFNENEIFIPSERESVLSGFHFDLKERTVACFGDNAENMFFKRSF